MDEQAIKHDLLALYDFAHTRDNWSEPLNDALDGVTASTAAWKPAPDEHSIWDIVNHMTLWTNIAAELFHDPEAEPPESWPKPTDPSDAAWQSTRAALDSALQSLREQLAGASPEQLFTIKDQQNRTLFVRIGCVYIHNAYHTGQITKLRDQAESEARR